MTIWDFNKRVTRWLLRWNLVNIAFGLLIAGRGEKARGIASQNIGWGAINIGIAQFGSVGTRRRYAALPDPDAKEVIQQETRNLRRVLLVNSGLDLLYILGGKRYMKARTSPRDKGIGQGIMIQGALLLVFDVILLLLMPTVNEQLARRVEARHTQES